MTVTPVERSPGLSVPAQTYVLAVGLVAGLAMHTDSSVAWSVLMILALPLSLVAMWVGFYGSLAVGFWTGADHGEVTWPVLLTWVAVWTATAWINARLAEKVLRRGWDALRTAPRRPDDEDDQDDLDLRHP